MARVSYSGIADYSARTATKINGIWTPFQTQSTNIDDKNVRDEGLVARNIVAASAVDGFDIKSYAGAAETFTPAAAFPTWTNLVFTAPATTMSIDNGGAGWDVGTGVGYLRVRFCTEFGFDQGARAAGTSPTVYFRLSFSTNAGTVTPATATALHRCSYDVSNGYATGTNGYNRWFREHDALIHLVTGSGGVTHVNSVKVQWASSAFGAANHQIGHCSIQAVRFREAG